MDQESRILSLDYGFSQNIEEKLEKNQILSSLDLRNISEEQLANLYAFSPEEIQEIKQKFHSKILAPLNKTSFFSSSQQEPKFITSGCASFDRALGGRGLATRKITQISGNAGAGKTQFCIKACLTVQLPRTEGGLDGDALYIETEDCFRSDRAIEMAESMPTFARINDMNSVLRRIHFLERSDKKQSLKIVGVEHLCSILLGKDLEQFLEQKRSIRLMIIDSISYLFRYDYDGTELCKINQQMNIGRRLKYLANKFNLAILITNQVKFSQDSPSMNDLWNSIPSTSILLKRRDTTTEMCCEREGVVLQSVNLELADFTFRYTITKAGIQESCVTNNFELQ